MKVRDPVHLRPLSRQVDVKRLPEGGLEQDITAKPDECAALAADLDLPAVSALTGHFVIARRAGGRFEVSGEIKATVTQVCVVTLDAFESTVEQPVELTFAAATEAPRDRAGRASRSTEFANPPRATGTILSDGQAEAEDPPDPLFDDTIDLGVIASEFLALALDPYPKKPGVHFEDTMVGEKDAQPSPFAALERLKERS